MLISRLRGYLIHVPDGEAVPSGMPHSANKPAPILAARVTSKFLWYMRNALVRLNMGKVGWNFDSTCQYGQG